MLLYYAAVLQLWYSSSGYSQDAPTMSIDGARLLLVTHRQGMDWLLVLTLIVVAVFCNRIRRQAL